MWIFTRHGFISAVHKPGSHRNETICVRARTSQHLAAVLKLAKLNQPIVETEDADYRFRTWLTKLEFTEDLLVALGEDVDYDNFKSSVTDPDYLHSLHAIWHEMHDYQCRNLPTPELELPNDHPLARLERMEDVEPVTWNPNRKPLRKTKRQAKLTVTKPKRK